MTKYYVAREDLGKEVAGVRNPGFGKEVALTASQAAHALRLGHLTTEKPAEKKAPAKGAKG